jgi:hypothetical protein
MYYSKVLYVYIVQKYEPASASSMKKMIKVFKIEQKKTNEKAKKEAEDAEKRGKNLEEAKKIVIKEDASLPPAQLAKISKLEPFRGQRVKVFGWVHRLRRQGIFLLLLLLPINLIDCYNFLFRESFDVHHTARRNRASAMRSFGSALPDLRCSYS